MWLEVKIIESIASVKKETCEQVSKKIVHEDGTEEKKLVAIGFENLKG